MHRGRGRGGRRGGHRGRGSFDRGGRPHSLHHGYGRDEELLAREEDGEYREGRGSSSKTPWPIGYKRLDEMEKSQSPRDIVIFLASSRSGLEERLRGKFGHGMTQMLLKVFGKMSESDGPNECFVRVLQLILKNDFHEKISGIVYETFTTSRREETVLHLSNALKLMNAFLTIIPKTSEKKVRMTIMMLQPVLDGLGASASSVQDTFHEIQDLLEKMRDKEKVTNERRMKRESLDDLHSQPAPDDFRAIPVFPQLSDIHADAKPFLRTNLLNKAYQSTDHYLDVQFRLLREDFIRPLREGINEIIQYGDTDQRKRRYQNVKVYHDVKVEFTLPDQRGIMHRIHFSTDKLHKVRWNNTKRLLYGNLLCLSSDHFKADVLFAVVTDRRPEHLSEGYLTVQFVYDDEQQEDEEDEEEEYIIDSDDEIAAAPRVRVRPKRQGPTADLKKVYTMVETDAYFEAYRHVLAGLKVTEHIPLERYIVRCSETMQAPEYLRPSVAGSVSYDFSAITKTSKSVQVLHYDWPSAEDLGLNRSQAEAFKLALTNELAIIQGPPGTGKTYVGLAIMKILLKNKAQWFRRDRMGRDKDKTHCPVLVVCYTNHALDQFLEGIAKFSSEDQTIIRVGGRCKNEVTKQFSLNEVRRKRRNNKDRSDSSRAMRHTVWNIKSDLRAIEQRLQANINRLEASLHCIQRLQELERFIPVNLLNQFYARQRQGFFSSTWQNVNAQSPDEMLLSWLGLGASSEEVDFAQIAGQLPPLSMAILMSLNHTKEDIGRAYYATGIVEPMRLHDFIQAQIKTKEPKAAAEEDDEVGEEGEMMEESDLVQEQRLLDTDDFEMRNRMNEAQRNERQVKEMMKKMAALTFQDIGASTMENQRERESGGWQQTRHDKRKAKRRIIKELGKTTTMTPNEQSRVHDIHALSQEDRWRLYRTWVTLWRDQFRVGSDTEIQKYNSLARQLEELRKQEDSEILQDADVVAVTTTGAAKYRDLIYKLNSQIVVVEEAAEVLEAHIITSMPEHTKHLILIGDHQQLKPSPTVYELAKKYNLDTSLFERLLNVKVPHVTLNCQHRMRPEIADLLRPHIYKELNDHDSVLYRGEITGIEKSLFFLSHNVPEESVADGRSKKNQYEADFLVELCKYLIMQGYEPEQITILAMYTGQLFAFRNNMREQVTRGVRVTAVDNFQGEENDIILLSLVRSNEEEKIGFLGIENRICVALSRAKMALYCIGNMELLGSKSCMWRKVIGVLHEKECIGESLMLQCKNHPDKLTPVKTVQDFQLVPEGGCGQPCATRLDCGHVCTRPCHPDDHSMYQCPKQCDKILPCDGNHRCRKKCWQPCGPCTVKVSKKLPLCGHVQKVMCSQDEMLVQCKEPIQADLPCGHRSQFYCHQSGSLTATMCKEKCQEYLSCDHTCKGSCSECFQGRLHMPCLVKCNRTLVCGHACKSTCSSCPPCEEKCRTSCRHSTCGMKCGEPCVLCRERCEWRCPHYKCTKLCSEPCDRPPCNMPCQKKLKCGHSCIGLCGEPCPKMCRICDKQIVQELFFGDEDEDDARFVLLEDCEHIFTYQSLDRWMSLKEADNAIKMKECPRCKTIVWRSTRYGKVINGLLNLVNEVKTKMLGDVFEAGHNQKQLLREVEKEENQLSEYFQFEIADIKKQIKEKQPPHKVLILEEQFRRLQKLGELKRAKSKLSLTASSLKSSRFFEAAERDLKVILRWVCLRRTHSQEREEESFRRETDRMSEVLKFIDTEAKYRRMSALSQLTISLRVNRLENVLMQSVSLYDTKKKSEVQKLFKEIFDKAPELSSNLGISEKEKQMICKAMDFVAKGHWYKCPNGHIYAIADCGGATMTGVCPECKEQIGGTGHRLLDTNRVASEMDGATRPAYDPAMNYIPDDLLANLRRQGFQ